MFLTRGVSKPMLSKCTAPEPAPTQFFAPADAFTAEELNELGATVLGDRIQRPGQNCAPQRIVSGPLCRLYLGNCFPEPDITESAWYPKDQDTFDASPTTYCGGWKRDRNNYLSYRLVTGNFITVRWSVGPETVSTVLRSKAA